MHRDIAVISVITPYQSYVRNIEALAESTITDIS